MKKIFFIIALLVMELSTAAFAKTSPQKNNTQQNHKDTSGGYILAQPPMGALNGVAYSLNNNSYGYNLDNYFKPASTEKILTSLAAILYLGPDYQIETHLGVSQNSISNGKLQIHNGEFFGDIEIEFRGDPTLKQQNISALLESLKAQGIKTINGNVYLNYGYFAGHDYATGWSWDDLSKCFTSPPSAIIIDNNCVSAQLIGTQIGGKVTTKIFKGVPIKVDASNVEVVSANEFYGGCELEVQRDSRNIFTLSGCIPVQKPNNPLSLSLAIQDPNKWGVDIVKNVLHRINLPITGRIIDTRKSHSKFITIARYKSEPLHVLLKKCLHKSVNLIADSIAKTIGTVYYHRPANYNMASYAIRNILKKEGIQLGNSTIIDGSGLSSHNYITPRQMLDVLSYINKHNNTLHFIELLPVAGMSGTVAGRGSLMKAPLLKNVTAKTGTLDGVSNLAGFMTTKSGTRVPFVYFMNNLSYDEKVRQNLAAKKIAKPQYPHERKILEQIYNEHIVTRQ